MEEEIEEQRQSWVIDLEEQRNQWTPLNESRRWIYKVPKFFTDHNKDAFQPQIVSFGPYHYGEEQVKGMENLKRRIVLQFLNRSGKPVKDYLNSLKVLEVELMDNYEQLDPEWQDSDRFLQLMFMDGCFMLQTLINFSTNNLDENGNTIFEHCGEYIIRHIVRDMILIENQLPLLVLERLASVAFGEIQTMAPVLKLIQEFLHSPGLARGMGSILHVLDLYRQTIIDIKRGFKDYYCSHEIMQSATKLNEAGIRFKISKTIKLNDMRFNMENGVLSFPKIKVDSSTEVILLNLMAFELLYFGKGLEVATYVSMFMSMVHTPKDVSLLRSMGIINNCLGSEEEVAKTFNVLSKAARSISLENIYGERCPVAEINRYYWQRMSAWQKRLREWRHNLHYTYFKNPWTSISVVAAATLLALTVIQTIYAIHN